MRSFPTHLLAAGVSLLLFAAAVSTPALVFRGTNGGQTMFGWEVLLLGALGMLIGQFAWCANPILLVGLITVVFRQRRLSRVIVAIALFVSANTALLLVQAVPADEGGVNSLYLQYFHVGTWLWFASIAAMGVAAMLIPKKPTVISSVSMR
jgi:hypothetical protein